jgi:asparagine synthase (glutamine-hydrolysing)
LEVAILCGIAGFIDYKKDVLNNGVTLHNMIETLNKRGPDVSGTWVSHNAALGHRRLIVVDPVGGSQPMTISVAGSAYTIVYNGEIYNTSELRGELKSLGHHINTYSDTEVLLLSYIEWGAHVLDKLNGIFAFAIWDERSGRLFLARDRMGVKPLFYCIKNNVLIFASEIKAMLKHEMISSDVNSEGLCELFALAPARSANKTAFKDIKSLRPAECLMFSRVGTYISRYWQFESKPHTDSVEKTTEKLRYLICDSVEKQMIADVPVCTFLSGGLDSSTLSALASKHYQARNKQLSTFSIDYEDNARYFEKSVFQPNQDSDYIGMMSDYIDSKHNNVVLDTDALLNSLNPALIARDLPGMADVDSSLLVFCEKVKKSATVSLSGECADELFGGYPWFTNPDMQNLDIFPWANSLGLRKSIMSKSLKHLPIEDYAKQAYLDTKNETPLLIGESEAEKKIRQMFYLNIKWFMTTLLERKDRMSMAQGLEVRVPFCDHRIAQYAWNIPYDMKTIGNQEKGILRLAVKDFLPEKIYNRKKSPYPKTHNPAYLSGVTQILTSILANKNARIYEILDIEYLNGLLESNDDLKTPWFGQLMKKPQLIAFIIQLEHWLNVYNINIV